VIIEYQFKRCSNNGRKKRKRTRVKRKTPIHQVERRPQMEKIPHLKPQVMVLHRARMCKLQRRRAPNPKRKR
jgi:hypothetical protein